MEILTEIMQLSTKGDTDIINITEDISGFIKDNGFSEGNVTLFSPGSTAGISTIEYESGVIEDIQEVFEKIAPVVHNYHHHKRWGCNNGSSHIRSAIIKPSITIPFKNGAMILGTWQQVVFIDFDTRPRKREIIVQIIGNKG